MAKRQGGWAVCPCRCDAVYSLGSLAFRRAGSPCPGTAFCGAICTVDGPGFLRRGGLFIFFRPAFRAEFFTVLRYISRLCCSDLHCTVRRVCPVVPHRIRTDFRSPARDYAHGEAWVGRCALSQAVSQVGSAWV